MFRLAYTDTYAHTFSVTVADTPQACERDHAFGTDGDAQRCTHIRSYTSTQTGTNARKASLVSLPAVPRAEGDLDIVMLICLSFVP